MGGILWQVTGLQVGMLVKMGQANHRLKKPLVVVVSPVDSSIIHSILVPDPKSPNYSWTKNIVKIVKTLNLFLDLESLEPKLATLFYKKRQKTLTVFP